MVKKFDKNNRAAMHDPKTCGILNVRIVRAALFVRHMDEVCDISMWPQVNF